MARRSQQASPGGVLIVGLLAIALVIYIIKTLLITVAILAVPFGVWWVWDHQKRKTTKPVPEPAPDRRPDVDPVDEAIKADDLGLTDSAEYWRGHYGPDDHEKEAARRRERETAANRDLVRKESAKRADEARARFYRTEARLAKLRAEQAEQ